MTDPTDPHEVPHMINVIACDCHSHGLSVEPGDIGEDMFLHSWYSWHSTRVLSINALKDRLKCIWEILTEGKSCADCMILTKTSTNELIAELERVRDEVWPEEV